MKKHHFILLLLLGMFLMPISAMACGGKSPCKKEMAKDNSEKSCCTGDTESDDSEKGCEGKCGHANCGCSASAPSPSVGFLPEFSFTTVVFCKAPISQVKFSYTTPSISDGFSSIWLIPKIG